jgi:hypothetical protein
MFFEVIFSFITGISSQVLLTNLAFFNETLFQKLWRFYLLQFMTNNSTVCCLLGYTTPEQFRHILYFRNVPHYRVRFRAVCGKTSDLHCPLEHSCNYTILVTVKFDACPHHSLPFEKHFWGFLPEMLHVRHFINLSYSQHVQISGQPFHHFRVRMTTTSSSLPLVCFTAL